MVNTFAPSLDACAQMYVTLVVMKNPGAALRWGATFPPVGRLIAADYQSIVVDLKRLLAIISPQEGDPEGKMLSHSIQQRLFELERLEEWRIRPYYYVEKRLAGMVALYSGPQASLLPLEGLSQWVREFPGLVEAAVSNLEWHRVARLDSVHSAYLMSSLRRRLQGKDLRGIHLVSERDKAAAIRACETLEQSLRGVPESNPPFLPVGSELLTDWIRAHCGLDVDVDSLSELCCEMLRRSSDALRHRYCRRSEPVDTVVLDNATLKTAIYKVYDRLARWFGDESGTLDHLQLWIEQSSCSDTPRRMAYLSLPYVFTTPASVLVCTPSAYRSSAEMELDLAHEVYPGHHWERTRTYRRFQGKIGILTYESMPFIEGWAKYCEQFYADLVGDPELIGAADCQKALVALKALAAVWVHQGTKPFSVIVRTLTELTQLPVSLVRSVVIQAYFDPILCLSPLIGSLAFQKLVAGEDLRRSHNQVLDSGPMCFWGVSI